MIITLSHGQSRAVYLNHMPMPCCPENIAKPSLSRRVKHTREMRAGILCFDQLARLNAIFDFLRSRKTASDLVVPPP
jgi:hypothetical protein